MKATRSSATVIIPKTIKIRKCYVKLGRIDKKILALQKTAVVRKKVVSRSGGSMVQQQQQQQQKQLVQMKLKRLQTKPQQQQRTPVVNKTAAIINRIKSDKDLMKSPATMGNERLSKRTPKPNRRYINDVTISSLKASEKGSSDSSEEELMDIDSDNDFVEEELSPSALRRRAAMERPVVKSDPAKKTIVKPFISGSGGGPRKTPEGLTKIKFKVAAQPVQLNKRKIEFDHNSKIVSNKKIIRPNSSTTPFDVSDEDDSTEDNDSDDDDLPQRVTRNRKSDSPQLAAKRTALSEALNRKLLQNSTVSVAPSNIAPKPAPRTQQPVGRIGTTTIRPILKAGSTPKPMASPRTPTAIRTPSLASPPLAKKAQFTSTPNVGSKISTSPAAIAQPKTASPTKPIAAPRTAKPPVNVSDLEDFEQMPTFTIVNINDIINQKDEIVVIEKSPKSKIRNRKVVPKAKPVVEEVEEDDIDYIPGADSSDDDDDDHDDDDDEEDGSKPVPAKNSNRRKTQHTNLLSEKMKPKATQPPPKILNNKTLAKQHPVSTKPYRNIIGAKNGKLKEQQSPPKPAPRILNSTLCRNSENAVADIVAKMTKNNNETSPVVPINNMLNRSKENLKTYNADRYKASLAAKQPKTVVTQQAMIGGTNRRVRKITCFETWFVIKLPAIEPVPQKTISELSLIQMGNDINQIELPSTEWSYKITLQRNTAMNASQRNVNEVYTGEVQDEAINEAEKHMYHPVNIMFRRHCTNRNLRMQFDRAVIFKNSTFFINVDGKNIKLVGAPDSLANFSEIETLLQIVNDISLVNPFVEQSTYVI